MSLQIADNFSYKGKKPLDARLVCNDIPDMLALPTSTIYDGIIVYVVAQKKFYTYDSNNTVDPTLQQWRELTTAGILIQSATIDNVTTSATKGHLILTMSDGTTIDCGDAKGDKGDKGDGFAIIKLYTNVSDMTSDTNPVNNGQMVAIIDSSAIPLTAKVYIRNSSQTQDASGNENGYTFFCNLADATVIQGPQGPQGPQGVKGDTPVVTTQAIAATSSTPSGTKITFTTGTGSTAVSTSINVYNGKDGISVQSATINASGELVFTLSDASTINVGKISGNGTGGCITMLGCFDTAPTTFAQNDIYYNNLDGLIYKSANGTTWGTGTQPEKDILYISMDDHKIYSYTNNTFEVYGGGMIDISSKANNAIKNITGSTVASENGLYVEDLSNKVNALNIAQKTVNSELEYYYATVTTSSSGVSIKDSNLINYLPYLTNITSNLEPSRYNTKGVTLKKSKTYKITFGLTRGTTSGNGASAYIMDSDGNKLGNRGYFGSASYNDNIIDTIYTPTKDITVYPALVNLNTNLGSTYYPDCSFFQITEVGREVTIDPVEYVNTTQGIEDTPVGEIIKRLGSKAPKHYLPCDGTEYNIIDYPYLTQYFKDEFGSVNYFGGDGVTTFKVPDLSEPSKLTKISPIMTSDTTPSPYVVTRSSVWSAPLDHAWRVFDGVKTGSEDYTWISAANELNPWICVDLGTKTKMTSFKLWLDTGKNKFPEDFTLQGSNDGTNFTNIKSFTNVSSMTQASDGEIEFNLDRVAEYRYYKIYVDTLQITGGATYIRIYEWEMYFKETKSNSYIKYEPTYFIGQINGNEYIEEILDKQSFNMTASGANSIGITKQFTKPITDFDKIEFAYSLSKIIETTKDYAGTYDGVPTNITYTNDNKGFVFNGTSSQIHLQDNAKTFPLTVEIVLSATSYKHNALIYTDAPTGIAIGNWTSSKNDFLCSASTSNRYVIPTDFYNGTIRTLTVVYTTASNLAVYADGVLLTTTDDTDVWGLSGSGDSYIGRRARGNYFNGNIYGVRVYSRALSSSEVLQSHTDNIDYVVNNKPKVSRTNVIQEYDFRLDIENNKPSFHTTRTIRVNDIDYTTSMMLDITKPSTSNGIDSSALFYNIKDKDNIEFEQTINRNSYSTSAITGFTQIHIDKVRGIRTINKMQSI